MKKINFTYPGGMSEFQIFDCFENIICHYRKNKDGKIVFYYKHINNNDLDIYYYKFDNMLDSRTNIFLTKRMISIDEPGIELRKNFMKQTIIENTTEESSRMKTSDEILRGIENEILCFP